MSQGGGEESPPNVGQITSKAVSTDAMPLLVSSSGLGNSHLGCFPGTVTESHPRVRNVTDARSVDCYRQ